MNFNLKIRQVFSVWDGLSFPKLVCNYKLIRFVVIWKKSRSMLWKPQQKCCCWNNCSSSLSMLEKLGNDSVSKYEHAGKTLLNRGLFTILPCYIVSWKKATKPMADTYAKRHVQFYSIKAIKGEYTVQDRYIQIVISEYSAMSIMVFLLNYISCSVINFWLTMKYILQYNLHPNIPTGYCTNPALNKGFMNLHCAKRCSFCL